MAEQKPKISGIRGDVWNCVDLKKAIREKIDAVVQDAQLARRLENALAEFVAYKPASKFVLYDEPESKK
jgi:3-methyladenine DNA glycosylase Tag